MNTAKNKRKIRKQKQQVIFRFFFNKPSVHKFILLNLIFVFFFNDFIVLTGLYLEYVFVFVKWRAHTIFFFLTKTKWMNQIKHKCQSSNQQQSFHCSKTYIFANLSRRDVSIIVYIYIFYNIQQYYRRLLVIGMNVIHSSNWFWRKFAL